MRCRLIAALVISAVELLLIAAIPPPALAQVPGVAPSPREARDFAAPTSVAIDSCISRLDPEVDVGYERIAARCPDLARTLEQSGFAQWLPLGWKESRNNLSAGSLAELRAVVERELATHPAARVPRVEKLNEVLLDLGGQHTQAGGAWARFKKWLRDLLSRRDKGEDTNWFDRMVSRVGVSAVVGEIITYAALGIVVALALIIVFNELKAAGLLGRRMAGAEGESAGGTVAARRLPALGDIEKVPLLERPAMLLDVIAWKLASIGRLPPPGALTVREMERSADLQGEEDRRRLSRLALTAERARFAHEGVPQTALQQACDEGRELLQSVETLRAPAPATSAALEAST